MIPRSIPIMLIAHRGRRLILQGAVRAEPARPRRTRVPCVWCGSGPIPAIVPSLPKLQEIAQRASRRSLRCRRRWVASFTINRCSSRGWLNCKLTSISFGVRGRRWRRLSAALMPPSCVDVESARRLALVAPRRSSIKAPIFVWASAAPSGNATIPAERKARGRGADAHGDYSSVFATRNPR